MDDEMNGNELNGSRQSDDNTTDEDVNNQEDKEKKKNINQKRKFEKLGKMVNHKLKDRNKWPRQQIKRITDKQKKKKKAKLRIHKMLVLMLGWMEIMRMGMIMKIKMKQMKW